ncbi:hypothetical protein CsSME_00051009 [Camellia sinensis var. sinensis]
MDPSKQLVHEKKPKWEGKACAELQGSKAEQVWPLLEDFFGLNKWFPTLTTCLPIEGISGQPGCVRYCSGFRTPVNSGDEIVNWTKQKLLSIDPKNMTFSYSIVDGNVGFNSYVSTVKVVPRGEQGCDIEWRYEVEPVQGWQPQDLDCFIGSGLQVMAQRMEEAILATIEKEAGQQIAYLHSFMATEVEKKWEGRVSAKLIGFKADQIWPFLEDFFNVHKWVSVVDTCYGVEGTSGEPGCIRYCASTSDTGSGETVTKWALEKLVDIDRVGQCLSYEFVDSNIGFECYMATMKLLPIKSTEGEGSEIVWSFVMNPVEGQTQEGLVSFYNTVLQGMAQRMKQALGAAKQN